MSNGMTSPCPCGQTQDPQVVINPPGLAQISYRVDDFTGFRRAMLRPLPGEQAIGDWRPAQTDLGLQVVEWAAYLFDVLTFYNERIANESYLRTAIQPGSLANLVSLLGYQPAPGIAAPGTVAAIRSAAQPGEPLVIPAGMRLSSVATPGVPAQTFEVDAAASFTGPSSVPVTLPPETALAVNDDGTPQSVLLAGRVSGVKAGDQLVLVEQGFAGADDNWSLVTVGAVTPQADPATGAADTLVTFSAGGWGPTPTPSAPSSQPSQPDHPRFAAERTVATGQTVTTAQNVATAQDVTAGDIAVRSTVTVGSDLIGGYHWSPGMTVQPGPGSSPQATGYRLVRPTATAALWNNPSATGDAQMVVQQTPAAFTVHLSASVRAISPGDTVLFDCGAGSPSALAVVAGVAEVLWAVPYPPTVTDPPTPPQILVTHTALDLTLATLDGYALLDVTDPSTVTVRYAFKDAGTIIGSPTPDLPSLPATVGVPASYAPAPGTAAILADSTGAGVPVTVSAAGQGQVTVAGAGTPAAAIGAALVVPLQLLLDIVPVSRGTTVTGEVLGSGNAALISQSFTLSKSPLTYLASGNGYVAALGVYVDGVQWQQVPSFYGQSPAAKVFVVSRSADQTVTTVTFGDGVNGARLTSGSGNVVATYRYGSGLASPPAGRLTTISQPQPNLASIQNPVAVSGGNDPQSPQDIRTDAPASVFTFGRAISAVDYEVVAAQAPGVSRVTAYWTFDGGAQRTLVKLYVGDDPAAAAAAAAALAGSEDPNRPVTVVSATPIALTLYATLVVAAGQQIPAVVAAANAALSDLFGPAQMGIGQRLYRSAIDAALMVPGVVAVHDLTVTRPGPIPVGGLRNFLVLLQRLDEYFDPGEGSFFELGQVTMVGVSAG